jgi:hypothetical protein
MTTILILNAVSSLIAVTGIGGFFIREQRRARKTLVPLYVSTEPTRTFTSRRRSHPDGLMTVSRFTGTVSASLRRQ